MSYTTVLDITPGAKVRPLKELHNSHGSAPVIWDAMCQKYYKTKPHGYNDAIDLLWPRYKDLSIPSHERAVLMMTFDLAYITKKNYARAARDIRSFLRDFPPKEGYANHWPELAVLYESDPECDAIGLHGTSVSENPFEGDWNEEKEEYNTIDWGDAYEIYDELDSVSNKPAGC